MNAIRFTLLDLIIAAVMITMVAGVSFPTVFARSREAANRIKCSSNLRQIGLAMKMYANAETRTLSYPRTRYLADVPPVFYTGVEAANPFLESGPQVNDVTAAMFLLLRTQDITADVFNCPTGNSEPFEVGRGKTIQNYSNFRSQKEHSYGLSNPYPTARAFEMGFKWDDNLTAEFAIAADLGPGDPKSLQLNAQMTGQQIRVGNSPNHDGHGQNVLYADGHVDWQARSFVGVKLDNIYSSGGTDPRGDTAVQLLSGAPASEIDSVILPQWDSAIPRPSPIQDFSAVYLLIACLIVAAIAVGGTLLLQRRYERARSLVS